MARDRYRRKSLVDRVFGRLTVVKMAPDRMRSGGNTAWKCRCICGAETVVGGNNLISGNTKSCGCLRVDHGTALGRANVSNLKHFSGDCPDLPPPTIEANGPTALPGTGSVADQVAHADFLALERPKDGVGGFRDGRKDTRDIGKSFRGADV